MTKPDRPDAAVENVSIVELEAVDLEEWERDQHTPSASPENLAALVRQTKVPSTSDVSSAPSPTARTTTATLLPRTTTPTIARTTTATPPRTTTAAATPRATTPGPARTVTPAPTRAAPTPAREPARPVQIPPRQAAKPAAALAPPISAPGARSIPTVSTPATIPATITPTTAATTPRPEPIEVRALAPPVVPPVAPTPDDAPTQLGPVGTPTPVNEGFSAPVPFSYPTAPSSWSAGYRPAPDSAPLPQVVAPAPRVDERRASTMSTKRSKRVVVVIAAGVVVIGAAAIVIASRGEGDRPTTAQIEPSPPTPPAPNTSAVPVAAPPPVAPETPATTEPALPPAVKPAQPPRRPVMLGGKPVVVEYDNAATHHAEASTAARAEDEASLAKARGLYDTGNQRLFAGDANGAVDAYRSALAAFPGYVAGYRGLGLAYMQLGNNAEAAKALQTYVRAAPNAKDVPLVKKRIAHLEHP